MRKTRNKLKATALLTGMLLSLGVSPLSAQAETNESTADLDFFLEGVTVQAKRPDWEEKLSPGTVTVIRPDDYKGEQKDLPDMLKMVPGVHVREVNGKGQYTTVSVRGSSASQVGVFVDGVLFNQGSDAAADISTIPIHNVDRIEVYRGYIPARFGGTFMGGVINIVTKMPTKANVSANIGQRSFGGYTAGLQIDAPLGGGALMVGINRDQSDGDFKLTNRNYDIKEVYERNMNDAEGYEKWTVERFNKAMESFEVKTENGEFVKIDSLDEYYQATEKYADAIQAGMNNMDKQVMDGLHSWGLFTGWTNPETFYDDITSLASENQEQVYKDLIDTGLLETGFLQGGEYGTVNNYQDYINAYNKSRNTSYTNIQDLFAGSISCDSLDQFIEFYVIGKSGGTGDIKDAKRFAEEVENYRRRADEIKSNERWRKSNDYKNTDAVIKWQNENWLAKLTWKKIDRHLPHPYNPNYGDEAFTDTPYAADNPLNFFYHRNQELVTKEALIGRRDTVGNLEWGWSVNYLDQDKDYYVDNWQWVEKHDTAINTRPANSMWSKYDTKRLGGKIDGNYKAGDKHLIEFLIDGSHEKMDIDGWHMHNFNDASIDTRSRWRNYYEQDIFNAQVQDTITLNKDEDFWLTPSIRYNSSKIYGRSDRYDEDNDPQHIKWLGREDEQTDDKVTWQIALKKQFNDHFTMRASGGTYFRLLNMYEIAGDGAGILPMPNQGGTASIFPRPEEGSQWDLSAIWDGQWLGTDTAKFQLTYFGRDSDRMLQLSSWNRFFFVYHNGASAKVNGLEAQADLSWKKWDLNLQGTYSKATDIIYDISGTPHQGPDVFEGKLSYLPEWEGSVRATYRPNTNWSIFAQCRYVDSMFTNYDPDSHWKQSSLTTLDLGAKYRFKNNFQITAGVNDLLNKADDVYRKYVHPGWDISNIEYPIQGRTYYVTLQYVY